MDTTIAMPLWSWAGMLAGLLIAGTTNLVTAALFFYLLKQYTKLTTTPEGDSND